MIGWRRRSTGLWRIGCLPQADRAVHFRFAVSRLPDPQFEVRGAAHDPAERCTLIRALPQSARNRARSFSGNEKTRTASRHDGSLLPLIRRTARMLCIFGFRAVALSDRSPGFGGSVQGSEFIVFLAAGRCKAGCAYVPAAQRAGSGCMSGLARPGPAEIGRGRVKTRAGIHQCAARAAIGPRFSILVVCASRMARSAVSRHPCGEDVTAAGSGA